MVTQVSVQINIVDINDNSPTFDQDVYSGNVSETAADNTLVVRITAMDPDEVSPLLSTLIVFYAQ